MFDIIDRKQYPYNQRRDKMLTHERLKELFYYDFLTGIFIRKISIPGRYNAKAGDVVGSLNNEGYLQVKVDKKQYKVHRLAWLYMYGHSPDSILDHKNRIRTDNRINNLEEASQSENAQNTEKLKSTNTSGYNGVSFNSSIKKWDASVQFNRKTIYLGSYSSPEEANSARLNWEENETGWIGIK